MGFRNFFRKATLGLEKHFVNTTATISLTNPIYAVVETTVMGMPDYVSLDAKLYGSALYYFPLGFAYAEGMKLSRKKFKLSQESPKKKLRTHDKIYSTLFSLAVTPPIYALSGSNWTWPELFFKTSVVLGVSWVIGDSLGLANDVCRDLNGLEESPRLPSLIKNQHPLAKKSLFWAYATASAAATLGYFYLRS
jgi:hypothetical protein